MLEVLEMPEVRVWDQEAPIDIPCVTQVEKHTLSKNNPFLIVCTKTAELIYSGPRCPPECGGHPVCRACYNLARSIDR